MSLLMSNTENGMHTTETDIKGSSGRLMSTLLLVEGKLGKRGIPFKNPFYFPPATASVHRP
jgi:hypothetical protein